MKKMAEKKKFGEKPKTSLVWRAAQFHNPRRGALWSIGVVAVCLILAGVFFVIKSYLAALGMVLLPVVIFQLARTSPKIIEFKLTPEGIKINDQLLSYQNFKSFWITETPLGSTLNFEPRKVWRSFTTINLSNFKPERAADYLAHFLPEEPTRGEVLHDQLVRLFKL